MTIVPLRENNAYFGMGKQGSPGVAVAPSQFPRWRDGTAIDVDATVEDIWEGDTSRRLSLLVKNRQKVNLKLVVIPRPVELGFLEAACMGAGSDSYTAPTVNTTISGTPVAGATTFNLVSNTGLTASGTATLDLSPGTANEEVVTITTPGTGAGPYTFTLAAAGTLKYGHTAGDVAQTSAAHALTDQSDGNYYTCEVSLGGTAGIIIRVRDCKVESVKRSGKAGTYLEYEVALTGIACAVQVSASSITLENRQPFHFTQGVWTLDGSTGGDAPNVTMFDITQKNNLDADIQTEQLTLAALIFGSINVDMTFEVIIVDKTRFSLVYFGGTAGTADALPIGQGSLLLLFTEADTFHTLQFKILTLNYVKAKWSDPKKDGKAFRLAVDATSTSNMGQNAYLLQSTVTNTQIGAY